MITTQIVKITLDEQNRLMFPDILRNRLHLQRGMQLFVETDEQGHFYLRFPLNNPEVVEKAGILVVRAELVGDIEHALELEREQRNNVLAGIYPQLANKIVLP